MTARGTMTVVPTPSGGAVARYDADVIERCYALWSTIAGMNASATVRWYAQEVAVDTPIPTPQTVRTWAREENWLARREADFTRNQGQRLFELQSKVLAIMEAGADVMLLVQAGAFDDNPMAGAVRLKPSELAGRWVERGIVPLMPKLDTTRHRQFEEMPREEQEAAMREALQGRRRKD